MARVPNPVVDGKQIQAVVIADDQGNYVALGGTGSTAGLGLTIQGPTAPSLAASMGPVLGGTVDSNNNLQALKSDANQNLYVTLGTGLDNQDDNVTMSPGAWYLAPVTSTFVGGETVLNQVLSTTGLAGPAVFDLQSAILYVENKSGATLNTSVFYTFDTVGVTTRTNSYVVPSVNINNNTVGALVVPWLGLGSLKSISASFGLVAAAGANGTIKTQAVLFNHVLPDQPLNYTVFGNITAVSAGSYNQVIAGPGASQRLYLQSYSISNGNASIATIVTLNAASGGVVIDGAWIAPYGGRSVANLGVNGMGIPVGSINQGLFMQATTASANIAVFATCRVGV